jgi:hypothetical protein
MSIEHPTDDFDWVSAAATCNAESMFQRLQLGVRKDIERRNGLVGRTDHRQFELIEDEHGFEVTRSAPGSTDNVDAFVTFECVGPRINIHGDGVDVDMTAIVGLNPGGDCRFFVGEAEYLEWEVRKLALDHLFFDEAQD